ncbi:hypothetical protein [Polynucleobacter sp.]|jgi:hypothetical protein|uniref:hypothetical protein n=1 Tax=Polynucleobacter sp. TaxID=2029855 RepID=UPI003019CC48
MGIKQLNATYLIHEDRILFRFNTDEAAEFRLWFTRRVSLFILGATAHLYEKQLEKSHAPETAKAIAQFEQANLQDQITQSDTSGKGEEYQGGTQYPLGADALLVMDVKCQLSQESGVDVLSLDFVLPANANLNIKLDGRMLQALCVLLNHLAVNAQWQTSPQLVVSEPEQDPIGKSATKIPLH